MLRVASICSRGVWIRPTADTGDTLGHKDDFNYNPTISKDKSKHILFDELNESMNNPYRIFCYSHNINLLSQKIDLFQNDFILVTHNSDDGINETSDVLKILNCSKLLKWFGQNICFQHEKLYFLPIGIANSQWPHGNISIFYNNTFISSLSVKTNNVFFNFSVNTNKEKRQICYDNLINKVEWLTTISPVENLIRLSTYKFCICPEGNGVDTHRLWECLNLKVVPIVIKSDFTETLLRQNIPLVVLSDWSQFDIKNLNYEIFTFDNTDLIKLLNFNNYLSYLS
jgi:hypothetical protein